MKRLLLSVLLLALTVAAHASYEAGTPHHAVKIDLVWDKGDDVVFVVTVTELPSGKVLAAERLAGKRDAPSEKQVSIGAELVKINVGIAGTNLVCKVRIERGGKIVDSIEGVWPTEHHLLSSSLAKDEGPLRVGGDVKRPVLVHREAPVYTEVARKARIEGVVIIEAIIAKTGVVNDARVLKPLPFGLDQAAVDAVRKWTFRPGTFRGKPVDVIYLLTVNFRLPPSRPPASR